MKYSLRSLMIVITLIAIVLGGRIEYLRRWALYHENQASIFGRAGAGFSFLAETHQMQASTKRSALDRLSYPVRTWSASIPIDLSDCWQLECTSQTVDKAASGAVKMLYTCALTL